jgi:hypothetical protein
MEATNKPAGRAAPVAPFKWKKGQSGNPSGKPKGTVSLAAAVQRLLRKDPKLVDNIAKTIIDAAIAGDLGAARLLFERLDGTKPTGFFSVHVDNSDRRIGITVSPQTLAEIADSRRKYEAEKLCPPPTT